MTDLDRTGFFSCPTSTNVGDRYVTRNSSTRSAYHGRQFLCNGQKWGKQTPDCYIDKEYRRLTEGDPYISRYQIEQRGNLASKKLNVVEKPFRPTHPAKTSKNRGGLDGTIGDIALSLPEGEGLKTDPKYHPQLGPRNFTICAPKTAPAGYPLDSRLVGTVPEYMPEPYHPAKEKEKEIKRKARERIVKPWGATGGRSTKCFDENPYANMSGFISRQPPRRRLPEGQKPFTPSGPGKRGNYAFAKLSGTNYINWNGEPYRDSFKNDLLKKSQLGDTPFRPIGATKSVFTPSINPYTRDANPPPAEVIQ